MKLGPVSPRERREAGERWKRVAELLDVKVVGWTGDQSATFWNPRRERYFQLNNAPATLAGLERRKQNVV